MFFIIAHILILKLHNLCFYYYWWYYYYAYFAIIKFKFQRHYLIQSTRIILVRYVELFFSLRNCLFFQYCDNNKGIFSISPDIVTTRTSLLDFYYQFFKQVHGFFSVLLLIQLLKAIEQNREKLSLYRNFIEERSIKTRNKK